jgi:hypothetical protein
MSKLFVGNLSFKVTDADLQKWIEENGFSVLNNLPQRLAVPDS